MINNFNYTMSIIALKFRLNIKKWLILAVKYFSTLSAVIHGF